MTILNDAVQDLFSCDFRRFVQSSVIFRHVLVILSIFLFTFILGSYTENAIVQVAKDEEDESKSEGFMTPLQVLYEYGKYTLMIYGMFLLTTKCDLRFLIPAFLLIVALVFLYTYDIYTKKRSKEILQTPVVQGIEWSIVGLLVVGFGVYAFKQYSEHKNTWNALTFLFGTAKCRGM